MVIKVGDKWCKATTTWKFWWNFLAKSILFSRYPSFSPFERPDAYKCYIFSESYGSRETREIKILTSKFDLEARGILSSLWTQTGPWSDTASYVVLPTFSSLKYSFWFFRAWICLLNWFQLSWPSEKPGFNTIRQEGGWCLNLYPWLAWNDVIHAIMLLKLSLMNIFRLG